LSKRILLSLCLLLTAGVPCARPDAAVMLSPDTDWQSVEQKDGVTIFSRSRAGSSFKEFKGVGEIDAPPAVVERVLLDVPNFPNFMPYVVEARILSVEGNQALTYQRVAFPLVSNRDYTLKMERGTVASPAGMIYRDTWQADSDAGPPERHGVVRVKMDEGCWLLEPTGPGGASTQATYQIYTDSGGALPAFLANRGCQMAVPKLFDAIRKQVQDPKYRQ
jgi:hypothetical protein